MSPLEMARMLLDLVLALIPHHVAATELGEAARRRANAEADAAEIAKGLK